MNHSKKIWLTLVFLLIFGHSAHANGMVRMSAIRQIESGNRARAWNRREDARGLYQVRKCVLVEYNQYNHTKYNMDDLWSSGINEMVAKWYLEIRIPQMLRHFHVEDTTKNRIIAYNAGISNAIRGRIPDTTRKYLEKYEQLTK